MSRYAVIENVEHVIREYRRFLRSTYRLADPHLRSQFEGHIEQVGVLAKGPFVTLGRDFAQGKPLSSLVNEGTGHKELLRLKWPFGKFPLYRHQENALRRVHVTGRSVIIKTGTNSGKTEAFLLPVISGVADARGKGVTGTKAILLYPMNALANDQLVRLRELIRSSGSGITFAMYTGESEAVVPALGEPLEGNELYKRADIRANPPDIVLTNYKELEFMLVRKDDRALFVPSLRFLVLDEIHSYRGALATEIACLIRRLKARCSLAAGTLRCIGTSATVSQDVGGDEALAEFAADLFGEKFAVADVIGEELAPRKEASRSYTPPFVKLEREMLEGFAVEDDKRVIELAERITGQKSSHAATLAAEVAKMFEGNQLVALLEDECTQPRSLEELGVAIRKRIPAESAVLDDEELRCYVQAYLLTGSIGGEDDPPILRPKLHTFFHGVYDVGLCMNPGCRKLVRNGSDVCSECCSAVRPAALCRTCGQDFVKVHFLSDRSQPTLSNDSFLSDEATGFITPKLHFEAEDEDDGQPKRKTGARKRLVEKFVCHRCARVHDERPEVCGCGSAEHLSVQHVLEGHGSTCPACGSTYPKGDILALLRSGAASNTSVLATHHLDHLPKNERKLLVFADNRQEAAHQAGYMGDKHRQFAVRHALESIVRDAGEEGVSLVAIKDKLLERFQNAGLAPRRLGPDERADWRKALEFDAAGEFCRATHQRISLENLALVEVRYDFLDELIGSSRFAEICEHAGIAVAEGGILVRAILDRMRRGRAVNFDFFQRYIDPTRDPWPRLQEDCFITIPERDRGPVFYLLDRSEATRQSVSGFTFNALTKDTKGPPSAVGRLMRKAGIADQHANDWIRKVVGLLASEEYELLETPAFLPPRVRSALDGGKPVQLAARRIRLMPAREGYRCEKCQMWRPYSSSKCCTPKCSGERSNLKKTETNEGGYYERLYMTDEPRRLLAEEHTAQIDQNERAKRESAFKEGKLDVLVCSPTLELGVNIGDLFTVLLRNGPPTPANYIQRAGRAGRRLRIGFVSTFCGVGAHDRHCFENPEWLVRGEYRPPTVRLDNSHVLQRHVRSFVLEELENEFPLYMKSFVDDLDHPTALKLESAAALLTEIKTKSDALLDRAAAAFAKGGTGDREFLRQVIAGMSTEIERLLNRWFARIHRIFEEFVYYRRITADRQAKQKAAARERAYRELTTDRQRAYGLNFLAEEGFLPSYQFPTDTFVLDPGINDTPSLRRPSWIALFEFAPGSLVYANGHKLRSIRAFFEGRSRGASEGGEHSLEASGRVRSFCFCDACGFATEETLNNCPECGTEITHRTQVAFIESFEAEQNMQISSAEESRERAYFERREHLLKDAPQVTIFPYPFAHLELRKTSRILVSNWGKTREFGQQGERFDLCPSCGRHLPKNLSDNQTKKWHEDHAKRCNGHVNGYVLGYEFNADALIIPIPSRLLPQAERDAFCLTLGTALVTGAVELLELEPEEITFFHHPTASKGSAIVLYETAPGGAGYLEALGNSLAAAAQMAIDRLYNHDCAKACYRCLKSYRNQLWHHVLDKNLIRDILFQFSAGEMLGSPQPGNANDGIKSSEAWTMAAVAQSPADSVIEQKLCDAIKLRGRLPLPVKQREFLDGDRLLSVADFAYENEKIAIYCDGFAFHSGKDMLALDAQKRNELQAQGWAVLTFWGKTILKHPDRCEEQIWRTYCARKNDM
jgi:ATP-dependent helicase YprA (DUF1998 family)/very-short-patch-repair endonuclease